MARELRNNEVGFAALERTAVALLGDVGPTRLRLHDILLWLATTLRMAHAVQLGRRALDHTEGRAAGPGSAAVG